MDVASLLVKIGLRADTKPLDALQGKLESINGKLRILAGAELIRGLFHLTENFGHSALELENTAAAAGMTTDAMQALQFAVAQTGGNAGELGMTMSHLARLIESAKLGGDEAITTFYKLGISQQQIASFHSTEDALYGVMDALGKIKDPIKQHAMLDQALGQGSRGLAAFALGGTKAAKQSEATAKRIGALVPPQALNALARAKGSVDALGMMFRAVAATIGGTFAPVVVEVVGAVEKFYSANKAIINQTLEDWVVGAAGALGFLVGLLETIGGAVFRFAARHAALLKTLVKMALAFVAISSALETLTKVLGGVRLAFAAVKGFFAVAPYLAVAAAIALAAAALHDFYELYQGGKLKDGWLYQAFTGTGKVGAGIQNLMAMSDEALKDAGLEGFGPDVANHPMVRGFAAQSVVNNMSANIPPPMIAAPPAAAAGGQVGVQVNSNVTVNVPSGMTPADAKNAVATGVRDHMNQDLAQAMQRFRAAHLY